MYINLQLYNVDTFAKIMRDIIHPGRSCVSVAERQNSNFHRFIDGRSRQVVYNSALEFEGN